ncbi:hypothetical protein DRV85_00400 [Rhodosalinus halophilus]|uniref:HTH iclR-type domain-containing protein n=1 Tax=Rhodosalinus halophilus TaxID=2259333 RepID=A0A365UDI4_9RHOB|nr:helix-turn-helix domain-containing protein [Rhodosalinus halophilus]RBI87432.1 hypothetical protein DRV85_00400 [Rhodosalinus halophilus]
MAGDGAARSKLANRARREGDVATILEAHYPEYQYRVVQFLIEHLSDVSRTFKGDLQSSLVLAVIGQVWLNALKAPDGSYLDPAHLPPERLGTSATRISDVTGIPRQTVRRKLEVLEERGWIVRNPDCIYRLSSSDGETAARRDLSDLDARAILRFARLFTDLEKIVTAAGQEAHETGASASGKRA